MNPEMEKAKINLEIRSIMAKLDAKEMAPDVAQAELAKLEQRMQAISQLTAVPPGAAGGESPLEGLRMEKRTVTLGSNGDAGFTEKTFEIAQSNNDILGLITVENGALPNTRFPLFSPTMNNIKRVSEDGTGASASTAAFAPVTVTPFPYLGYVGVSDWMLKQVSNLQGKLTALFGKAFARQIAHEIVDGSGSGELTGLKIDTDIDDVDCAAAGAPKLKDFLVLISKLTGKFKRSELTLLISPADFANICTEDTKFAYVNHKGDEFTLNGVRVIESDDLDHAANTAGTVVGLVGFMGDYGLAIASQAEMENLGKVAGSLVSNIQGTMYLDGSVIVPSSFKRLVTV